MLGYLFSAVKNAERDASLTIRARFNILDENELHSFQEEIEENLQNTS